MHFSDKFKGTGLPGVYYAKGVNWYATLVEDEEKGETRFKFTTGGIPYNSKVADKPEADKLLTALKREAHAKL